MTNKHKRIIFISNSTIPSENMGGGSVVVYRHLKRLKDNGHNVLVVYISNFVSKFEQPGYEFEQLRIKKKWWYPPFRKKTPFLTTLRATLMFNSLLRKVQFNEKNDLILGILGEVSNLVALKIKLQFAIPIYFFYHDDTLFNRLGLENLLTAKIIDRILNNSNYIFSASEQLTNLLETNGISNATTLYPIPQGYYGPFKPYDPIRLSTPNLSVSGMILREHVGILKNIGRAANEAGGKFYCITTVDDSGRALLTVEGYMTVKPKFETVKQLFDFAMENIDIIVVYYSFDFDGEPRILSSFPSKFVEYCHLGLPILIVAPGQSSLGLWAKKNNWLSYVDCDEPNAILQCIQNLKQRDNWENCSKQSLQFAKADFNPEIIHHQFTTHLLLLD